MNAFMRLADFRTPLFEIHCAVSFRFKNNHTIHRISRRVKCIRIFYLAHLILSLIFFFGMSKFHESYAGTFFQIISIPCVITYVLLIMDFVYFIVTGIGTVGNLIEMVPWHMKKFLLDIFVISQFYLFFNVIFNVTWYFLSLLIN